MDQTEMNRFFQWQTIKYLEYEQLGTLFKSDMSKGMDQTEINTPP